MTKYNPTNCPGPGDEATWPAYAGHPNDPRAPDDDQDFEDLPRGEQIERLTDEFSNRELAAMYLDEVEVTLNLNQEIEQWRRSNEILRASIKTIYKNVGELIAEGAINASK